MTDRKEPVVLNLENYDGFNKRSVAIGEHSRSVFDYHGAVAPVCIVVDGDGEAYEVLPLMDFMRDENSKAVMPFAIASFLKDHPQIIEYHMVVEAWVAKVAAPEGEEAAEKLKKEINEINTLSDFPGRQEAVVIMSAAKTGEAKVSCYYIDRDPEGKEQAKLKDNNPLEDLGNIDKAEGRFVNFFSYIDKI